MTNNVPPPDEGHRVQRTPLGNIDLEWLVRYLFGSRFDPADVGLIGRLQRDLATLDRKVNRLLALAWALLLVLVAGLLGLLAQVATLHR